MSSEPIDAKRKQLVGLFVMVSGVVLVLSGAGVFALNGQPLLGAALIAAGVADLGLGVYLRISG